MSSHANPKAKGYAFSLNLVRSLGLWSPSSTFPTSVAKPTYITLTPSGAVDWSELLRKYLKHNTSSSEAELVAAQTRLELAIWQAVDRRDQKRSHGTVLRRRQERALQSGTSNKGKETATDIHDDAATDEWVVTDRKDSQAIRESLAEMQDLHAKLPSGGPYATCSHTLVALARRTQADHTGCLESLQAVSTSTGPRKEDIATHDLDLQVLATVLRGLALEQIATEAATLGNTAEAEETLSQAVQTYRTLPTEPPPPIPEAQRYMEVGLSRLAFLASGPANSLPTSLEAYRTYSTATQTFANTPAAKRMLMYHAHLATILRHLLPRITHLGSEADAPDPIGTSPAEIANTFISYEQLLLGNAALASFPRAGDPTHNVYAYMALLYAFWELGQLSSQWVVDSLYRALTRTFASQRLHRYLVIVLSTMALTEADRRVGRKHADDAIRNLRLYVKLFEKSRETDQIAVQREVNAFRRKTEGEEAVPEVDDPEDENNPLETDEDFCRVACMGTRLLLVESRKDGKQEQEDDRLDLIREALDLSEKAIKVLRKQLPRDDSGKDKLTGQDGNAIPQPLPVPLGPKSQQRKEDSGLISEAHLWYGVAQAEYALAEADPETARPKAKTALKTLSRAVQHVPRFSSQEDTGPVDPKDSYISSSIEARALYSLAFAQLEVRDVTAAAITARRAVEALQASPTSQDVGIDYRIWHLLVLTISARKDWAKAKLVAEMALSDVMELEEENSADASRFADTTYALDDESAIDGIGEQTNLVTPGDAPHDPLSTGVPLAQGMRAADKGDSESSSYINVTHPNAVHGDASKAFATGDVSSDLASLSRKRKQARFETANSRSDRGLMTHRTTTAWDDLEAEVDLWITRNRCIEAVEGPEVALQDLQRNVFTRFSTRRDELEDQERRRLAAATAATRTQPASTFPHASPSMRNSPSMQRKLDHQRAHTVSGADSPGRARSLIGTIGLRHRARTNSAKVDAPQSDLLGVPRSSSRPDSIHSNESNATSGSGSHLMGANASMTGNTVRTSAANGSLPLAQQHPHSARILSKLWLASAASFRRWGKLDECRGAISEAEDLAGETDPDIWVQYALFLQLAAGSTAAADMDRIYLSLQKAIAISTDHVPIIITISKIHLEQGKWAMAEGFLDVATQTNAWDSPEAWFLLAKVYEATKRDERARECLLYALELEQSRPIRDLRSVLFRWV